MDLRAYLDIMRRRAGSSSSRVGGGAALGVSLVQTKSTAPPPASARCRRDPIGAWATAPKTCCATS